MTRPPSSMPRAPVWPFFDHSVQASPPVVPEATSVAVLVSVAAGPPDAAALVAGAQVELAGGTLAVPAPRPLPGPVGKLETNWPGGSCQMPWLAVMGTRRPGV